MTFVSFQSLCRASCGELLSGLLLPLEPLPPHLREFVAVSVDTHPESKHSEPELTCWKRQLDLPPAAERPTSVRPAT